MSLRPPTQGTPSTATFESRIASVESRSEGVYVNVARLGVLPGLGTINAAINDYIAANPVTAQKGGITFGFSGNAGDLPYNLANERLTLPPWVNIIGAGARSATRFLCTGANSGLDFRSRKGLNGNFSIDADSIATEPVYMDTVDGHFLPMDIRNSAGNGLVIENAQNTLIESPIIQDSALSGVVIRNGASANVLLLPRITGFNRYAIEVLQQVAQGAAYPNGKTDPLTGAPSTVLAQSPILNKIMVPMIERMGTTVGGGVAGVGLGGLYHRGGSTVFYRPQFSIVPTTADTPVIDMEWDGIATTNKVLLEDPQALGSLTFGIFIQIRNDGFASRAYLRATNGGEIQAFRAAYKLSDVGGVIAETASGFYNNVTTRLENFGAGTKTYDQLVRASRQEPFDFLRPASTDQILTTKRTADAGYRAVMTADGILYQGDASTSTPTLYPGLFVGNGSPEGTVSARIGSVYRQMDAAATGSAFWVKASGTGTTGWVQGSPVGQTTVATDANAARANGGPQQVFHTGTLTANRTYTLNALTASGQTVRVTRTGGGAFTLDVWNAAVAPLKSLATNQWADFLWDGTNWKLTAFGSL